MTSSTTADAEHPWLQEARNFYRRLMNRELNADSIKYGFYELISRRSLPMKIENDKVRIENLQGDGAELQLKEEHMSRADALTMDAIDHETVRLLKIGKGFGISCQITWQNYRFEDSASPVVVRDYIQSQRRNCSLSEDVVSFYEKS